MIAGGVLAGCSTPPAATDAASSPSISPAGAVRYVALGDSYTVGTSVALAERFPNQLVEALRGRVALELVANLGVNGYATADLLRDEMPHVAGLAPSLVTLLIGVNDAVRGVDRAQYLSNVEQILDQLLALLPPDRIVAIAVPDYTRTPSGGDFGDPAQQRAAIADFNSIMADAAAERGVAFVDIGPVADLADRDQTLVARDGLHPSGAQYARWVELIAPVVEGLISDSA
jgi:lysophospholipase L1-like esterase